MCLQPTFGAYSVVLAPKVVVERAGAKALADAEPSASQSHKLG